MDISCSDQIGFWVHLCCQWHRDWYNFFSGVFSVSPREKRSAQKLLDSDDLFVSAELY